MQLHFEWDPGKAQSNLKKHNVSFAEAALVFRDPLALSIHDEAHREHEERWITMGEVNDRRLVVVAHTWREADDDVIHVRIISARTATAHEAKQYRG